MPEHRWAPPIHPDPPEDQPLGIDAPPAPEKVSGYPAVWVRSSSPGLACRPARVR
ncbi:hypothetical protein ACL00T_17700 (plasmid) [Curtobacterium flaccumfaciens]